MESLWLTFICAQPSLPLITASPQPHRWRQQQVCQETTCCFARLPGAQLHKGLWRMSGQGQTRLFCGSPWEGVTFHRECREVRALPSCASYVLFLARSGEFSMQSVSLLVTGSSPSPQAHQGFLKENQNNLPNRVKTWGKISLIQRCSVMEGGTALPLCWL